MSKKTTAMVVAAGMRAEAEAARQVQSPESKVQSHVSTEAARMLETGLTAESHIAKLEREAIPYILVAGAAFHLAKAKMEHGQWESTIKNATPMSLWTVQKRMQSVDNALARLGYELEERAYKTIVFSSKIAKACDRTFLETPYTKGLAAALNDAFAGKTGHQLELELGIRAPKKLAGPRRPRRTEAECLAATTAAALEDARDLLCLWLDAWTADARYGRLNDTELAKLRERAIDFERGVSELAELRKLKRLPAGWRDEESNL